MRNTWRRALCTDRVLTLDIRLLQVSLLMFVAEELYYLLQAVPVPVTIPVTLAPGAKVYTS